MAVHRENCMVPSTLSPEHPQRIVPYVGGVEDHKDSYPNGNQSKNIPRDQLRTVLPKLNTSTIAVKEFNNLFLTC
jgi:hypothetical protein